MLPAHNANDSKGLRIDLAIEDPATHQTLWVDVSVVHTSSPSYLPKEIKFASEKQLSAEIASDFKLPDILQMQPSPSLLEREKLKTDKYSRLVVIAKHQHLRKQRFRTPDFKPFIISDFGELAPSAINLQEFLVHQYKLQCSKSWPRPDGCSILDLTHNFRYRDKRAIQFAIAAGIGAMIQTAGQSWARPGFHA